MQTACSAAPSRDLDTVVLEARHLLGLANVRVKPATIRYPRDPITIAKVLALREESGLARERFCDRVWVGPATMWCWEQGQTGGGKPWPELAQLLSRKAAVEISASLSDNTPMQWAVPPRKTHEEVRGEFVSAIEQAVKRLEGLAPPVVDEARVERLAKQLSPPVVGVAFPKAEIAPKVTDDGATTKDLLAQIRRPRPGCTLLQHGHSAVEEQVFAETHSEFKTRVNDRIRGAEVTKARDEAYAAFQAASDRMPLAEAAADLVVAYRRSHRGLEGFCRGHYDAATMAKRLAQWTAGRDEQGEQWDRLIGLLNLRGVKPSINGLGKRVAKAGREAAETITSNVMAWPTRGWIDLAGDFHPTEDATLTASWGVLVQRATDEILTQAARAGVTLRSFLMSDEAQKPVADLSRALEGREAHQRAMKGAK